MKGPYPVEATLAEIRTMDEQRILLKARNLKHWSVMDEYEFEAIRKGIEERLKVFGYEYQSVCCGRYQAVKVK